MARNNIPTPQVILSYDMAAVASFSRIRNNNGTFSGYKEKNTNSFDFVFTHDETTNLLNFKSTWGKGSSSQAVFELEILDPAGKFERTFFKKFYDSDKNSWQEIISDMLDYDAFGPFNREDTVTNPGDNDTINSIIEDEKTKYIKGFDVTIIEKSRLFGGSYRQRKNYLIGSETSRVIRNAKEKGAEKGDERFDEYFQNYTSIAHEADGSVITSIGRDWDYAASPNNVRDGVRVLRFGRFHDGFLYNRSVDERYGIDREFRYFRKITPVYDDEAIKKRREELESLYSLEFLTKNKYEKRAKDIKNKNPFLERAWISFGVGDKLSTYAPAMNVKLFNVEYGLSPDKVRTLKLKFVPSTGLAGLEVDANMISKVTGTQDIEYSPTVTLESTKITSIATAMALLIEKSYSMVVGNDCNVYYLCYDLKEQIEKKFAEVCYDRIRAKVSEHYGVKGKPSPFLNEKITNEVKGIYKYLLSNNRDTYGGDNFRGHINRRARTRVIEGRRDDLATAPEFTEFEVESLWRGCLSLFFKSIGIEYNSYFNVPGGRKIDFALFDQRMDALEISTNRQRVISSRRHFLRAATESNQHEIALHAKSPEDMNNKVNNIVRLLNSKGDNSLILNFPEREFLVKFNTLVKTHDAFSTMSVDQAAAFVVTRKLYKSVIQGKGWDYFDNIEDNSNSNSLFLEYFIDAHHETLRQSPVIEATDGFPDPYEYLSTAERRIDKNFKLITATTNDELKSSGGFENYLRENKIPLFVYGFKNSNILNFNFDLQSWFYQFLRVIPSSLKNNLLSSALKIGNGNNLDILSTALDVLKDEGTASEEFNKVIEELYYIMVDDFQAEYPASDRRSSRPRLDLSSRVREILKENYVNSNSSNNEDRGSSIKPNPNPLKVEDPNNPDVTFTIPNFEQFKLRVTRLLLGIIEHEGYQPNLNIKSFDDLNMMDTWQSVQDKVAARSTFAGTIECFPICSIVSPLVVGRTAFVYMVEPYIMSDYSMKGETEAITWLSGEYWIMGYEVKISNGTISTSFDIQKKPQIRSLEIS
jgi:hypothetical protein